MCRALLYLGQPILIDQLLFQPDSSLVQQSYMPRMARMLNLAGFGMVAWESQSVEPEKPFRYASTVMPIFDHNLKSLAGKIKADCFLGHVRGVSMESTVNLSRHNIHPFWYPGTKLVLAHNGDLYQFAEMREDLRAHIRPQIARNISGSTDSEWIYAILLSQLDDPGAYATGDELRRAIERTLSIIGSVRRARGISVASSCNLFITEGQQIFAVRFCFDFGCFPTSVPSRVHEADLSYLSLWYTLGREYGLYDDEWKMIGGPAAADSVMVASEPLTKELSKWLEVPEYCMLHTARHDQRPVTQFYYIAA
jgi:glutamine amidotransferase